MKDGDEPIEVLFRSLKTCYKAMRNGGVLLHCKNGANRATLMGACMVIVITGCSAGAALRHVFDLRSLCDICEQGEDDTHSWFGDPIVFLEGIEDQLRRLCINLG